jgi:hypothetical protein
MLIEKRTIDKIPGTIKIKGLTHFFTRNLNCLGKFQKKKRIRNGE